MTFNPMRYPASLRDPQFLTGDSAWVGHIPFAFALVEMARPRMLVELGTYRGDSYCAFCQGVVENKLEARCFAVDTWKGDVHMGAYDQNVLENLRRFHDARFASFSTLVQSDFDSAAPTFADASIDVLHIDGTHTYEAVRHDYETWRPKVSDRGVILFHDTEPRSKDFGVWRLWEEISPNFPSFAFAHESGLGVLGYGSNLPPAVTEFLREARERPDEVRAYFTTVGQRMVLARSLVMYGHAIEQATAGIDRWRQATGREVPPPVDANNPYLRALRLVQGVNAVVVAATPTAGTAGTAGTAPAAPR